MADERERVVLVLSVDDQGYASKLDLSKKQFDDFKRKIASGSTDWLGFRKSADDSLTGVSRSLKSFAASVGVAFSIGAVVNFAKHVVSSAGAIDDMSKKLGISAEAAQRFKFAAEQGGATIADVERALGFMNRTLAAGEKSTINALRSAGLEFQQIRAMKPEDAFRAIAEGIRQIPDPMKQAEVATKLFGKSATELLPAIKDGITQVGDQTEVMSAKAAKAIDEFGDAFGRLKNRIVVAAADVASLDFFSRMWSDWSTIAKGAIADVRGEHDKFLEDLHRGARDRARIADIDARTEAGKRQKVVEATDAMQKKADADEKAAKAAQSHRDAVKALAAELSGLNAQQHQRKLAEAVRELNGAVNIHRSEVGPLVKRLEEWKKAGVELLPVLDQLRMDLNQRLLPNAGDSRLIAQIAQDFLKSIPLAKVEIVKLAEFTEESLGDAVESAMRRLEFDQEQMRIVERAALEFSEWLSNLRPAKTFAQNFVADMSKALKQLPSVILGAIQGGGNVGGAVGGFLGGSLGQSLQGPIAKGASKMLGSTIGAAIGSIIPGIGTLIGAFAGAGIEKMIGALRGSGAKANDLRDIIKEKLGGDATGKGLSDLVFSSFASAGFGSRLSNALDEAYTRFLRGGTPEAVQRAADDMARILEQIKQRQEDVQQGFVRMLGAAEPFFGKAPRALRGLVEEMRGLNGLTEEQRRLFDGMLKPATWKEAEEILESLGSSSERLGENLKKAKQVDFALDLTRKLEFLEDAGADVDGVLFDMREKLSDFVNEAAASRTALPETLRPFIERAIELGLLMGPNGEIREGIEGIDFADIPDEPLLELKDAILALRDAILGLGPAAGKAADEMNRQFDRVRPPDTRFGSFGPDRDFNAATQGMALPRSSAAFAQAGSAVVPRSEGSRAIVSALGAIQPSTGEPLTEVVFQADGYTLARATLPHTIRILDTNDGGGGPSPRAETQKALRIPMATR